MAIPYCHNVPWTAARGRGSRQGDAPGSHHGARHRGDTRHGASRSQGHPPHTPCVWSSARVRVRVRLVRSSASRRAPRRATPATLHLACNRTSDHIYGAHPPHTRHMHMEAMPNAQAHVSLCDFTKEPFYVFERCNYYH
eukprot:scaffold69392_cov60-Phaeocystis_antarctica.AAC.2